MIVELGRLFDQHGKPEVLRSDNGREFIADSLGQWLADQGVKTAFIAKGRLCGKLQRGTEVRGTPLTQPGPAATASAGNNTGQRLTRWTSRDPQFKWTKDRGSLTASCKEGPK